MDAFLTEYGILTIALFILGEDLGLPLFAPSTLIFTYAALTAANPEIPLFPIIIVSLSIPPIANYFLFFAGRHGLRKWLSLHGHKFFLPSRRIEKAEKIFEKHGEKTVFFAACVSTIRPFCSLVAGSLNMNPLKFAIYHFLGVCVWASIFITGGYFFGATFWIFLKANWFYFVLALIFAISAIFTWKKWLNGKNK